MTRLPCEFPPTVLQARKYDRESDISDTTRPKVLFIFAPLTERGPEEATRQPVGYKVHPVQTASLLSFHLYLASVHISVQSSYSHDKCIVFHDAVHGGCRFAE